MYRDAGRQLENIKYAEAQPCKYIPPAQSFTYRNFGLRALIYTCPHTNAHVTPLHTRKPRPYIQFYAYNALARAHVDVVFELIV